MSFDPSLNFIDKYGKTISLDEWSKLVEDKEYRIVKQDHVGKYFISTIWNGMNTWEGHYLETALFDKSLKQKSQFGDHEISTLIMEWRYPTIEWAIKGHQRIVESMSDLSTLEPSSEALVELVAQELEKLEQKELLALDCS